MKLLALLVLLGAMLAVGSTLACIEGRGRLWRFRAEARERTLEARERAIDLRENAQKEAARARREIIEEVRRELHRAWNN